MIKFSDWPFNYKIKNLTNNLLTIYHLMMNFKRESHSLIAGHRHQQVPAADGNEESGAAAGHFSGGCCLVFCCCSCTGACQRRWEATAGTCLRRPPASIWYVFYISLVYQFKISLREDLIQLIKIIIKKLKKLFFSHFKSLPRLQRSITADGDLASVKHQKA